MKNHKIYVIQIDYSQQKFWRPELNLKDYAEIYRKDLTEQVIPFWLKNSLDRECGGYFTCLDHDGSVYDRKKYIWLQGREVWMFCRLYNEFDNKPEYLDAAKLGLDFLRKNVYDTQGRCFFSLQRDGRPFFYQRKPYGAVFYMLALLEYFKATNDESALHESVELFHKIRKWIADPTLMGRLELAGGLKCSGLADTMVVASMVIELKNYYHDEGFDSIITTARKGIKKHYDPQLRIFRELVPLCGENISEHPEGRLFSPGHSIEVAWFLLHLLELQDDPQAREMAFNVIEGSLELGWDKEFGGLYYFMDLAGKPTLQLESSMKLWWPHTEALYALVLAAKLTGKKKYFDWLDKVHDYAYSHFVDEQYGEWFGYCDRRGNLALTCKGGNYKGFFHVPRALLMCMQAIERL